MERQKHGFEFEQFISSKYGVQLSKNYTSNWDGTLNGIPVSIKCEKLGSDIELADYFRNSIITENFYLFVGFWAGDSSNIVETRVLYIDGHEFHSMFDEAFNTKFQCLLDTITNDSKDDKRWKESIAQLHKEWQAATSNLIRPRFKRDHKTQKRIQCAINNGDFYNYFCKKYEVKEE